MADVDDGDILRLAAVMEFKATDEVVNVMHVQVQASTGQTYPAMATIVQAYMDALYANLTTPMSSQVLPKHLSMSNITKATVFGAFAWGTWAGGGHAGDPTAAQVACLAYARTPLARVQIRKYLGIFTEDSITLGRWTTAVTTPCDSWMGDHIAQYSAGGGTYLQGVAYSYTYVRATLAVSPHVSAVPVIQRRRREGRGS